MPNWGNLTSAEQTLFAQYQAQAVVDETIEVVIGGISDLRGLALYAHTDRAIESDGGLGFIQIGRAYLVIDNTDGVLFDDGESKVAENADVRIWMGYKGLNVPVFTGEVRRVTPRMGQEYVVVDCADKMLRMWYEYTSGSVDPDNTPKEIVETFCSSVGAPATLGTKGSGAGVAGEIIEEYGNPTFDYMRTIVALQNVQNSIFHVALFDEAGTLQMYQRDRSNPVDWTYTSKNIDDIEWMAASNIINSVDFEYDERFFAREIDQQSIDDNGEKGKSMRVLVSNSETVSESLYGTGTEELDNDREAFKITSSSDATIIDGLQLSMGQDGSATGDIVVKIYTDSSGPGLLLATSKTKAAGGLWTDVFVWEAFRFETPANISPNRDYWVEVDTSEVTGTVYIRISRADATAKYAYYSGGWTTQDDKTPAHKIRGSRMARRAAADIVRFYKDERDIIRITSLVGVPQFSLFDEIGVDAKVVTMSGAGRYVLERVEHTFSPAGFTTRHTMRSVATGKAKDSDLAHRIFSYPDGWVHFTLGSGKVLGDAALLGYRIKSPGN